MARIDGLGGIEAGARSGGLRSARPAASDAAGFELLMQAEPAGSATAAVAAGAPGNVALLGAMLAAQEWDGAGRNAAGRRHGQAMLDTLGQVQQALLGGAPGSQGSLAGVLGRLAGLAAAEPPPADPDLAALLGAIRLRAQVELARLGG